MIQDIAAAILQPHENSSGKLARFSENSHNFSKCNDFYYPGETKVCFPADDSTILSGDHSWQTMQNAATVETLYNTVNFSEILIKDTP